MSSFQTPSYVHCLLFIFPPKEDSHHDFKRILSTIHKEDPSMTQKMEVISPLQKKTAFGKPRIFNSITGLAAELPFKVPENTHWKSMSVVESQDTSNQAFIPRRSAGPIWFWFLWGETKTQQKRTSKRTTAGFFRLMKTPTTRWNTKAVLGTWNREADLRRFVKDRGTDATTGLVSIIRLLCQMAVKNQNRYCKLKITSPYFDHFWHPSLFSAFLS